MTPKLTPSSIGERIATARVAKNMSQAELARLAQITRSAVAQMESGLTRSPSAVNIFKIADALGVDPRELTFGASGKPKSPSRVIADLLDVMPDEPRQEAIDFTLYKFERNESLIASDKLARYLTMIDHIKADMDAKRKK